MDDNDAGRRGPTRTMRHYYVGKRYLREVGNKDDNLKQGRHVPKPQVEGSAADRIAKEERLGRATVERAARMAAHIDEACAVGLGILKWPILQERVKYTKKLLDDLINLGAGGCRDVRGS